MFILKITNPKTGLFKLINMEFCTIKQLFQTAEFYQKAGFETSSFFADLKQTIQKRSKNES